jgi:hypothetical protein
LNPRCKRFITKQTKVQEAQLKQMEMMGKVHQVTSTMTPQLMEVKSNSDTSLLQLKAVT